MRVLLLHPWGRFDPVHCGASRTAVAHLEYARARGWDVHCVRRTCPAWDDGGASEFTRFGELKSVRSVSVDCPPLVPYACGEEFRRLLYAGERAARSAAYRAIAAEPWDAFLTTDVTAAPFAHALPRGVRKVLAAGDTYARRAAAAGEPAPLRAAEERFAFARIEAELYRLFDRVLFAAEADAHRAGAVGVAAARHVPPLVEGARSAAAPGDHDLVVRGGGRGGELADLEWFYRHIYLPHLRADGVRLTVAGPLAARFPVCDLRVTKLPAAEGVGGRVVVVPAAEAAGPHVAVGDALAAGAAVVTTPEGARGLELPGDAAVVIEMRAEPGGTAVVLRDLLAAPGWCRQLGARAAAITDRHPRHRFFAALDAAWNEPARIAAPRHAEAA